MRKLGYLPERRMIPKIIKTEEDHEKALARIYELMDAKLGTPEGDELKLLTNLVELYEKKVFPIGMPSPIEAIQFRMEQMGTTNAKEILYKRYVGNNSKRRAEIGRMKAHFWRKLFERANLTYVLEAEQVAPANISAKEAEQQNQRIEKTGPKS